MLGLPQLRLLAYPVCCSELPACLAKRVELSSELYK